MAKTKDKPPITEIGEEPADQGIIKVESRADKLIPHQRVDLQLPNLLRHILHIIDKEMFGVTRFECYKEPISEARDAIKYFIRIFYWPDAAGKGSPARFYYTHVITKNQLEGPIGLDLEHYEHLVLENMQRDVLKEITKVAFMAVSEDPKEEEEEPKQLTNGDEETDS